MSNITRLRYAALAVAAGLALVACGSSIDWAGQDVDCSDGGACGEGLSCVTFSDVHASDGGTMTMQACERVCSSSQDCSGDCVGEEAQCSPTSPASSQSTCVCPSL